MMSKIPTHLERILDLARWAPSGDNTQPWRFEVLGPEHVLVHGFDTREHCVYDLDGHPSQLAVGALLETISLAATAEGRTTRITRRPDTPDTHLLFDVRFEADPAIQPDPLVPHIEKRVVQRRAMSTRPLTAAQKTALEAVVGASYKVVWFEGLAERWRMAKLSFDSAKIRLTIPEAYAVHKTVIEWDAQYSEDRIPDRAVGADPLNLRIMRWAMASWERVEFFNAVFLGHLTPRLQLDLVPGLRCAAHFALLTDRPVTTIDDYVAAGRAVQRFWLTAARLGLYIQPEMTPVIFSRYQREGRPFTQVSAAVRRAGALNIKLTGVLASLDIGALCFLGRIGVGAAPRARSVRLPLHRLLEGQSRANLD
jgi:nitroreductase